jgi:hypothetical protein
MGNIFPALVNAENMVVTTILNGWYKKIPYLNGYGLIYMS